MNRSLALWIIVSIISGALFFVSAFYWLATSQQRAQYIQTEDTPVITNTGSFTTTLNGTSSLVYRQVGIVGPTDEVHVKYNCSSGGLELGLIEQQNLQKLSSLPPSAQLANVTLLANDYTKIQPHNIPVTINGITHLLSQPIQGESIFHAKGRISGVVEFLFAGSNSQGQISCTVDWQLWTFPNANEYNVQIADADNRINQYTALVAVAGIFLALGLAEVLHVQKKRGTTEQVIGVR